MKNNQSSDLGFIIFLVFAGIILIPLYFGVNDIGELVRLGKIILTIMIVLVVISFGLIGYLIYRKKFRKPKIKEKKEAEEDDKEKENTTKILVEENDNVTIVLPSKEEMEDGFLLNDDQIVGELLENTKRFKQTEKEKTEIDNLQELNRKFNRE